MTRRFPSPWTAEVQPACFVVRDRSGQAIAYVCQALQHYMGHKNIMHTVRDTPKWRLIGSRISGRTDG
jgi:hypothetical protein